MLTFADRQSIECVVGWLGHKNSIDLYLVASQFWNDLFLEPGHDGSIRSLPQIMNSRQHQDTLSLFANTWPGIHIEVKRSVRSRRSEQMHVTHVYHRRVCRNLVLGPDRPSIESLQGGVTTVHVGETSNPYESIGPLAIAKLTNDRHADVFLGFDEMSIEEGNQGITLSGFQRVLP
jgi:hypothetical protein